MRAVTFCEQTAFQLYHQQKNDTKIAEAIGKDRKTVLAWRKRRGLPSITLAHDESVDYRDVLTLKQSAEMNRFLKCLSDGARKASQEGIKVDVNAVISAWRG